MKKISFSLIGTIIITLFLLVGCKQNKATDDKKNIETEKTAINEFETLANYLESNGNFINSKSVPAMVSTKEVFENRNNEKYKIIDIRDADDFIAGHIKNAINVYSKDMISYFEDSIVPKVYDKVVMVCYSGQSASYTTGIMRMLGYDNVYAMKYGMSSWNKDLAKNYWSKKVSNDFSNQLETTANPKAAKGAYPTIKTGKDTGLEILKVRAQIALNTSYKSLLVKAPEIFGNPTNYYILNYWPEDKYNAGHISGSIQYTPKKTLSTKTELSTLPIDKEIVTYCYTGQHAGFVTSYLKVLGYDAKALAYGANSFMNTEMKNKEDDWHAFSAKKIAGYDLVVEKNK